jgi:hypothetical protein
MAMKIYFCDLCNESIPQEDLEKNRVTTVRDKMICAKCVPPASAAGQPPSTSAPAAAPAGGGAAVLVALLALVAGGAGLFVAHQTRTRLDAQPDLSPSLRDVERTLNKLLEDFSATGQRLDALAASLSKLERDPPALREALAEQLHRLEKEERDMQEVRALLGSLRSDREVVQRIEVVQSRLDRDVSELKGQLQAISNQVAALGTAPAAKEREGAGAAVPAEEGPAFDAETKKQLGDLSSKDASTRWSAVDRLAKKHDPRLVPYLLPMLEDSDAFVQFRVISTLRDLNARGAVARLIKLLRDGDAIVREEALDALVALTGNPLRPEGITNGTPAEREKGVKAWEEWFEKNKDRFPEPGLSS